MALLELRDISKRFGGLQALARVKLDIEAGTIASLIGPNGAGKTTLFNILTGVYRPDGGEIRFLDRPLMGLKPERITKAGISRTFQNIRLFSHMTVLDNVLVGMHSRMHTSFAEILLRTRNFHNREDGARSRAMELIELTGLGGRQGEWPRPVPGGERAAVEGDAGRACRQSGPDVRRETRGDWRARNEARSGEGRPRHHDRQREGRSSAS